MTIEYHPLTLGQQKGYEKFMGFYCDPAQTVMQLRGYSGTGKSTLIKTLLRDLPNMAEMCRTIAPDWKEPEVMLTATTNQAAEALYISVDCILETKTIHSALSLRLHTPDYRYNKKVLQIAGDPVENKLIFIDEASFIDQTLLGLILKQCINCKIVFVGDPAQITPIETPDHMPAFEMDACQIELTDLVRFDPGPMTDIVTDMRRAVLEQKWSKIKVTPGVIERVDRDVFKKKALEMFRDPDVFGHVKILAFSNNAVTDYNNLLSKQLLGTSHPQPGMKMAVNEMVKNAASSCYTNEEVQLAKVEESTVYGVQGWEVQLVNKAGYYFMPRHRGSKNAAHQKAVQEDNYPMMQEILNTWIDLRPTFSCTVNKSQGSTYDFGLIDLDDIARYCRTLDQLARMLYVGISRFRKGVIFTGDLRRK